MTDPILRYLRHPDPGQQAAWERDLAYALDSPGQWLYWFYQHRPTWRRGACEAIKAMADRLAALEAENERLAKERDEAREAARWLLPLARADLSSYLVCDPRDRWPWLKEPAP